MVTKEEFHRFVRIQKTGACNMISAEARHLALISRDTQLEIIQNYNELLEQYGEFDYEND